MLKTSDALKLIEQLQNFVVHRNEVVEELQNQLSKITDERDCLKREVENLQRQNSALKMFVSRYFFSLHHSLSCLGYINKRNQKIKCQRNF